jgi:hypothetical protein
MTNESLTPEQVAVKGERIYQEKLKTVLEPSEIGKFVAIEVESGDYFVGESIIDAIQQARAKYPDKLVHTIKVGYEGVFKMGSYSRKLSYGWKS